MEGKRTDCLKVDFTPVEARYVRVIGQGFPALRPGIPGRERRLLSLWMRLVCIKTENVL